MAISQVGFSNTFSQWLVATNQAIIDLNKLESGNYTKLANTFTITSTGTAFQVTSGTSIFSAPVNITSTLTVDNNATFQNAVNLTATGSPLNVSNNSILGSIQVTRDSTFSANISANGQIISTKPSGIAPFVITSNTVSTNLNADLLDGFHANTSNSASTIVARGADGSETSYKFISTAATGVAPLTVSSTTLVTNLNADLLDGYNTNTANSASTVVVRNSLGDIEGNVLKSNVTTGIAPLTVASTTKVANLNADLLDGYDTNTANSASTVVVRNSLGDIEGNVLKSNVATGSAPLIVASTTKVTNLNADLLDGFDSSYFAANTENEIISGQWTYTKEILGIANSANKLANTRWFNFSGDVAGSGSFDGTGNTNITLTVQPDSVILGTDTTGKYVGEVKVSGTGLSVSNTAIEGGDFTVTSNASSANGSGTIVARNTAGDFNARSITLEAATGVAPFAVSSTTLVTNLNADLLDGNHVGTSGSAIPVLSGVNYWSGSQNFLATNNWFGSSTSNTSPNSAIEIGASQNQSFIDFHSSNTVVDYNARIICSGANAGVAGGDLSIIANTATFSKDVIISGNTTFSGTNPLNLTSTSLITNLNADLLDGYHASTANSASTVVVRGTDGSETSYKFISTAATGVAPLNINSTTLVANLNADLLDGYHASTANSASTVVVRGTDGSETSYKFISTAATGVAPFSISSTTVSTNLNADLLDGYHVGTSGSTIPLLNTINTWSANQIINGNLNVSGDLNISGNTIFSGSTINDSGDYLLRSNTGSTSSPDSTFTVKRNASPSTTANNAVIKWDNTALSWKMNDVSTNVFYNVLIDKPLQTVTGTWTFNNEIKSTYSALNSFNLVTATTATNQVIASVLAKSAEFLIQANTGASSFHTTKLLAMHDGTTSFITEYGTIMNGSSLATYDCDISGSNLRLLVTPINPVTTFKVSATYIN